MLVTNKEWRGWGDHDPMWGVASWQGRQKAGNKPWTTEEFYALGLSDWADFKALWSKFHDVSGTVLEVGCGAGRITHALADTFETVIAVDVSPGMLRFAREHVTKPNIRWADTDGSALPAPDDSVDCVFSCHVLQHLPSPDAIFDQFREMHRVLKPGGSLCVHLHVHAFPHINRPYMRVARALYRVFLALTTAKAAIRRQTGNYMHGVSVEMSDIFGRLDDIGFETVRIATVRMTSNNDPHICVIASKPEPASKP